VSTFQITFVGPATSAVRIATLLADAHGVDLISSETPTVRDDDSVELAVVVEGSVGDVDVALTAIRRDLPSDASIELVGD